MRRTPTPTRRFRLQRGRRSESTEMPPGPRRYSPDRGSFKGAVDQSRRRCSQCLHRRTTQHAASKGPSIRVDGDPLHLGRQRDDQVVLQRGRRSESTEIGLHSHGVVSWTMLQRGRRSESTEIRRAMSLRLPCQSRFKGAVDQSRRRYDPLPRAGAHVQASKGPSIRVDGDHARATSQLELEVQLQRGRRSESTEIVGCVAVSIRFTSLQRGRRSESTEIVADKVFPTLDVLLQRGRRSESTEIRNTRAGRGSRCRGFKGAVDQSRRRFFNEQASPHHRWRLQRGRRSESTEIRVRTVLRPGQPRCFKGAVDQSRRRLTSSEAPTT